MINFRDMSVIKKRCMWYVIRKKARTTVISALVNAQNISDFISSPHSPESIFSPASSMECGGLYIATVSRKTSAAQNSLRNDSFFFACDYLWFYSSSGEKQGWYRPVVLIFAVTEDLHFQFSGVFYIHEKIKAYYNYVGNVNIQK